MKTYKEFKNQIAEQIEVGSNSIESSAVSNLRTALNSTISAADVAQSAHWNLRSTNFITLHPWLGETYSALLVIADGIAEQIKIKSIDNLVIATHQRVLVITDEGLILRHLKITLESLIDDIETAATNPTIDAPTKNLLEGWQGEVQKMKWFVEASLD